MKNMRVPAVFGVSALAFFAGAQDAAGGWLRSRGGGDQPLIESPQVVLSQPVPGLGARPGFRIASYNIQDFTDGRGEGRQRTPEMADRQARAAAALLNEINPDIAVIEEVENRESLLLLNRAMARPFPIAQVTRFGTGGPEMEKLNIAVLSRLPVEEAREIDFGPMRGKGWPPRGALRFAVDLGDGRKLLVYGVHLKSNWGNARKNPLKRARALEIVAADAAAVARRAPDAKWEMAIVGDVNVDPDSDLFADDATLLPLDGWIDLWRGRPLEERITVPTRRGDPAQEFPPATFDRIFVSPELTNLPWRVGLPGVIPRGVDTGNVFTVGGQDDRHVSYHYPVFVDVWR